ncbi:MAG TPA: sigma-54 dependent transcriptional regulator [Ignavibacteria bacterium]|nr:sigma-54 dependent transcriptional regulator [Ignavibacteria bacterium]
MILLVDDEVNIRILLEKILKLEGFEVVSVENATDGLKKLKNKYYPLVIADVKLPDVNGIKLTKQIKEEYPDTEVIVISAFGSIEDGVEAMKNGAFDYITKGDNEDKIIATVKKALEKHELRTEIKNLRSKIEAKASFNNIIGKSKEISEAIELAKKVAPTDTTVLILGETGTGKELFAEAIHYASKRKDKSFVTINCSAIPKDLQESELFGYKKGAFTGALQDKKGYFEETNGGTIFLDEIGDMSYETQAKLLRVIENGTYNRVGDSQQRHIDVRIIAATNKDLLHESERNNFRNDLYYRISPFVIYLPPLRERIDDLELLIKYFLTYYSMKLSKEVSHIEPSAKDVLLKYQWKGNIRELKNVIERAVILTSDNTIKKESLPNEVLEYKLNPSDITELTDKNLTLEELEKIHIKKVLEDSSHNKTIAVKRLGIGTATLYRKLKEYGLE